MRFIRLFRRLFGPAEELNTSEIEEMGLLAVKIAQMYAIRGDLLGPEKVAKLNHLYEAATPMAKGEYRKEFEEQAPAGLKEALECLEDESLAAPSVRRLLDEDGLRYESLLKRFRIHGYFLLFR